jgi:predicted lipoprotein with Yx(FWY)xxD motif
MRQRAVIGRWPGLVLRLAGAGLLAATGGIHLDLYLTGYKSIPTIGWLFLLQVIAAFALAAATALSRSRLVCAAGALFALSTLGGYVLSIWVGLFGFTEVRTTAGIVAGVLEVAAFAVLASYGLSAGQPGAAGWPPPGLAGPLAGRLPSARAAGAGVAGAVVLAAAVLAAAVASAAGPATATAGSLRTATIGGAHVLTNSRGFTLYWFAPDTPTTSKCYGGCAAYWPPLKGPARATGISGKFGTIKRTDGTMQVTYNGHPLYTYIGDSGPGQAHGNNLNINGGLWHEVTVPG